MLRRLIFALLMAVLPSFALPDAALAAEPLPNPPCAGAPYPAFPAPGATPNLELWPMAALGADWTPPACTGWNRSDAVVVALAGRFTGARDVDGILERLGNISALTAVRYWSVTDKQWNPLFARAAARATRNPTDTRGNFTAAEIRSGAPIYFLSTDNRASGSIVTHLAVKESGPNRIVVEMTNVSPVRWYGLVIVPQGGIRTLYFLDRQNDNAWRFYSLSRTQTSSLLSRFVPRESYLNRAVAMYRYVAEIPTDREPPAAP